MSTTPKQDENSVVARHMSTELLLWLAVHVGDQVTSRVQGC